MAATYPADTFQEGVDLTIEASNQLAQVVRGDANTEVTVADGSTIPSIRKAQTDSMYFKEPELWVTGQTETDYLQLKKYIDPTTNKESWWFAKSAMVSNPVAMGTSPFGDDNWTLYTPEDLFISGKAEYESVYQALKGKAAEAGYNLVRGSFEEGGTLTNTNDVLWYQANGKYYSWAGTFPKVVAAGATPATSGGIGAGAWVDRSDDSLRDEIRETVFQNMKRSYAEAGFNLVDGSFEAGGTLVNANDVLLHKASGKAFSGPAGDVAAGTDPTRGGFVDKSGELLRHELATSNGATKVGTSDGGSVQDFIDAQYTTVAELATGKFQVGQYVRLTDRAMGLFLLKSGGTADGFGILDAGNGNTAVAEKSADIRVYGGVVDGVTDNTEVISYMVANKLTGNIDLQSGVAVGKYVASELYNIGLVGGGKLTSKLLVPNGGDGIFLPAGTQLRDTKVANLNIAAQNALTGTGINTGDGFAVNTSFENLGINGFDIGLDMKLTSFSNVFSNVRANVCRRSFNFRSNGQCINNTFDGLYSSQPTELGMYMAGCKSFVFNSYNSGSSGAPHLDIAGGCKAIIFNSANFEQDAGMLASGSQAITVQSNSEVTFNQPVFAAPKSVDNTAYLFRVKNTAVVYIDRPFIVGADANIQHIFAENDSTIYLNDPAGVINFSKVKLFDNAKIIRLNKVDTNSWTASGKIASHPAGGLIITGLSTVPTGWHVAIDQTAIGDSILDYVAQVTQVGTGTLKVRYMQISTGTESFTARPLVWMAK